MLEVKERPMVNNEENLIIYTLKMKGVTELCFEAA